MTDPMHPSATPTSAEAVLPLRLGYRSEMNCQCVKDSIHQRPGWTTIFALGLGEATVGFATVAIAGPWKGKPTIIEFYVLPDYRGHAFRLFEAFLEVSGARLMEIQSNDLLLAAMLHTYARDVTSEAIVFRDGVTTALPTNGVVLQRVTSDDDTRAAIAERAGGCEWRLLMSGEIIATGGILFHYNVPYGDIYMNVVEPFRRRGYGAYLVQELKRIAYELGSIPGARCNPANEPSRRTLQKAGFVPYAHILDGTIPSI